METIILVAQRVKISVRLVLTRYTFFFLTY